MKVVKTMFKRSLAFAVALFLMMGVIASIDFTEAEAKSKVVKPGKPVITVEKGDSMNDVVITIAKTEKAEGYVIYVKTPDAKKYKKITTVKNDVTE